MDAPAVGADARGNKGRGARTVRRKSGREGATSCNRGIIPAGGAARVNPKVSIGIVGKKVKTSTKRGIYQMGKWGCLLATTAGAAIALAGAGPAAAQGLREVVPTQKEQAPGAQPTPAPSANCPRT